MSQKSVCQFLLCGVTLAFMVGVFVAPKVAVAALPESGLVVSGEAVPQPVEAVSFNSVSSNGSGGGLVVKSNFAISQELSFTTVQDDSRPFAISNEISFTTEADDHASHFAISNEVSATTSVTGGGKLAISGEVSATTQNNDDGGGGGGGGGSSGGGSGGSGGGGGGFTPPTSPPPGGPCPIFLRQFIKLGAANDRLEVLKLQYFLNRFEGFNLALTGFYGPTDFQAVEIFQARYRSDILTPWGINDSTGYVFITTRLAINNIFCARATANDLNLRNFYAAIPPGILANPLQPEAGVEEIASSSATTTAQSFFNLAALGLLNLVQDLILWPFLLFTSGLIFLVWLERRNERSLYPLEIVTEDEVAEEAIEEPLPPGLFTEDDPIDIEDKNK